MRFINPRSVPDEEHLVCLFPMIHPDTGSVILKKTLHLASGCVGKKDDVMVVTPIYPECEHPTNQREREGREGGGREPVCVVVCAVGAQGSRYDIHPRSQLRGPCLTTGSASLVSWCVSLFVCLFVTVARNKAHHSVPAKLTNVALHILSWIFIFT